MIFLELMELLHNLKEFDFEIHDKYQIDKKEAEKLIRALTNLRDTKIIDKAQLMRMIEDL